MAERFREMLLGAMGGKADAVDFERRQRIYERARQALAARIDGDPPMPAAAAAVAAKSLEQAIDAVEREANRQRRPGPRQAPIIRVDR